MAKQILVVFLLTTLINLSACGGGSDTPSPAASNNCVLGTSTLDDCTLG